MPDLPNFIAIMFWLALWVAAFVGGGVTALTEWGTIWGWVGAAIFAIACLPPLALAFMALVFWLAPRG